MSEEEIPVGKQEEAVKNLPYPVWVGPRGEFSFGGRWLAIALSTFFPLSLVWAGVGSRIEDLPGLVGSVSFFSCFGLSILTATFFSRWRRYRFLSRTVGAVAIDLAEHGLLRGREGRRRARTMKAYDKRAHELNSVISQIMYAEKELQASEHPEPLLLEELVNRKAALEAERETVFAQARAHYRAEIGNAAAAIAARKVESQNSSATTEALSALAAAREATYRQPALPTSFKESP